MPAIVFGIIGFFGCLWVLSSINKEDLGATSATPVKSEYDEHLEIIASSVPTDLYLQVAELRLSLAQLQNIVGWYCFIPQVCELVVAFSSLKEGIAIRNEFLEEIQKVYKLYKFMYLTPEQMESKRHIVEHEFEMICHRLRVYCRLSFHDFPFPLKNYPMPPESD